MTSTTNGTAHTDTEWVLPGAGAWRRVDSGGRELTNDGRGRFRTIDPDSNITTIRQGSSRFLGPRAFESVALPVLLAYQEADGATTFQTEIGPPYEPLRVTVVVLKSSPDDLRFSITPVEKADAVGTLDARPDDAVDPAAFKIPITDDAKVTEEADPGSRADPALVHVNPYWLGPSASNMKAVGALENRWVVTAGEGAHGIPPWAEVPDLHQVNYEPTSEEPALAWDDVNADALDVISTPIDGT